MTGQRRKQAQMGEHSRMNRTEFMRQLESLLQNISATEREEALQYYNEYFNDAGPENEQNVIEALGNPAKVAENIKKDIFGNGYGENIYQKINVDNRAVITYPADSGAESGAGEAGFGQENEAQAAGADYVGGEELIPKIQNEGWLDFDVVVATPDMMGVVGRLGRVLGPKGLMPNPKAGTVTMDVTKAVNDIKAGKIEYRLDKTNIIHVPVGKASFTEEQLSDNFQTLMGAINKAKPSSLKGQYIKSATITSTMGPGVKLNVVKIAQ